MTTLHEAAEQALEAMLNFPDDISDDMFESIIALKAALAESEAEPVAWMESPYGAIRANPLYKISAPQSVEWSIPLYTALAEPDGWRQCAKGQKTTQYCGLLEEAVKAEREACARVCELLRPSKREYDHRFYDACTASAAVIRARGDA